MRSLSLVLWAMTASAPAAAYPIDCAILLCLAGGFPPSAECAAAKAVFIRRITPFPIEPPLQVWNCPMGVSAPAPLTPRARLYKAVATETVRSRLQIPLLTDAFWDRSAAAENVSSAPFSLVQSYPSGDISDPAYDFVRSIKVWHLDYSQEQGRDECIRRDQSRIGGYDLFGSYTWVPHNLRTATVERTASSIDDREGSQIVSYSWAAPIEASIREADAASCGTFTYRAVVVTWSDYFGDRGFHEVRY